MTRVDVKCYVDPDAVLHVALLYVAFGVDAFQVCCQSKAHISMP